ncbi:MAG TPA: hypothetical protein VGJ84_04350 [Polyangiaceae bacterium]
MSVARSFAELLDEHVTLELECIDRMYLNLYVSHFCRGAKSRYLSAAHAPRATPPAPSRRGFHSDWG